MFQREVALRIVATPAERADYGRLAVLAGWRTQARLLFDVPPAAFTPPPKVTSSVVELIPRADARRPATRDAVGGDRRRLRPAPQDAAPVAEGFRRGARASNSRRCSRPPASTRPAAPRRSTWLGSARWRERRRRCRRPDRRRSVGARRRSPPLDARFQRSARQVPFRLAEAQGR